MVIYFAMLKCDPDKYRKDIASLNLTKEQEDDLLYTLWDMMRMFAEMGFGVESINPNFPQIFENADQDSSTVLEKNFNTKAERK